MNKKYDVLIIGAGPAGAATAICLGNSGLRVAVIDKATFPREKTCGDGLTHDVIKQLGLISESLASAFAELPHKQASYGAEIISPDHDHLYIPFYASGVKQPIYTCPRFEFDNFMFSQMKQFGNISVFENCLPEKLDITADKVVLETSCGSFEAKMILGADGANSFVARQMGVKRVTREHQCVSLRTYFTGLKPLREGNPVEMYILKDVLPGYLWIFHLGDGRANVGIGMLASIITKKKINLNKCFEGLLSSEPLKSRLSGGKQSEPFKGYILPMGGERRDISGSRFLLAGDAASLVDPSTGEGVGNAIRSGRVAAGHILDCLKADDFSSGFNKAYDKEIYRRMMTEFRFHSRMRNLFNYPRLVNFTIGSAARHKPMEASLQKALLNLHSNRWTSNAVFVLRILYIYTIQIVWVSLFEGKGKIQDAGCKMQDAKSKSQ